MNLKFQTKNNMLRMFLEQQIFYSRNELGNYVSHRANNKPAIISRGYFWFDNYGRTYKIINRSEK